MAEDVAEDLRKMGFRVPSPLEVANCVRARSSATVSGELNNLTITCVFLVISTIMAFKRFLIIPDIKRHFVGEIQRMAHEEEWDLRRAQRHARVKFEFALRPCCRAT